MNTIEKQNRLSKRTKVAAIAILFIIPCILFFGVTVLKDRSYMFISTLMLMIISIPFLIIFEDRKPKARELILLATLVAIGVAGRMAFFWLPQFKPVVAIVIVTGIALGGESGFLVGAMTGFVSNFYFSQGPFTPWQMFGFGIIGFLAGILHQKGLLKSNKKAMAIFGFFSCYFIYGLIMNPVSVLSFYSDFNWNMIKIAYLRGFPMDTIHAVATVVFLWIIGEPLLEKIERVKKKYGFYEEEVDYEWI